MSKAMNRAMTAAERWAPIPGFEGAYSVNRRGQVRSEHRIIQRANGRPQTVRPRLLAQKIHPCGLRSVHLCRDGGQHTHYTHKLAAAVWGTERKRQPRRNAA